jgi:hypothetical protein
VSLLLPQEMLLCLMLLLYIINALEVGVLMCLHLITQAYVAQFYAWLFFCLSFLASPVAPQLRFLGQAHVGPKRSTNKEIWYCNEATGIRIFVFHAYTLILEKIKNIYINSNAKAASCLPSPFRC